MKIWVGKDPVRLDTGSVRVLTVDIPSFLLA